MRTYPSTDTNFPAIPSTQQSLTDHGQAALSQPSSKIDRNHQPTAPPHTKKSSGFAPRLEVKEDTKSKEHIITQMVICQNKLPEPVPPNS